MIVQQFFVKGLAHSSYLLGGSNTCAIVDPRRDVDVYLQSAKDMGVKITHILETHLHADFISGHLDLAEQTGAVICAPKSARCSFKHNPVKQGDTFEIEDMRIKVLETPGHTPEHVSYVVVDKARGNDPVSVFCGDSLFVGDVGRPDLFPGRAVELATKLYGSLKNQLLKLPDFCEVYPAHGAGSLCGRAMGAKRTSTIGYEKKYNSALQMKKDEFVKSLTTNMPGAPDHFSRCSAINGKGPALTRTLPQLARVDARTFKKMSDLNKNIVVDIRAYETFGGQHVPGAYHIDFGGNFATFAGWILPPGKDIMIVGSSFEQAQEASVWLKRVGLDRAVAYLEGGMFAWAVAGFSTAHIRQLSAEELYAMTTKGEEMVLVDVRAPREYESDHVKGAINIPVADLRTRYKELDRNKPIALICSTGHRSSLGASILKQQRFGDVYNVAGGMTGYSAAGYSKECPICIAPHIPSFIGK